MPNTTFGQWLKMRRQSLDLTRAQVASQIGCAEITLGKIERDQRRASRQIAELLAVALCIPDEARETFVQFARGFGEPPEVDANKSRTLSSTSSTLRLPTNTQRHHQLVEEIRAEPIGKRLSNLPEQFTSFIGREEEIAELTVKVQMTRLLTLLGPGGMGKTRLALEVAAHLQQNFGDGTWLIDFAPVTNADQVTHAAASVFRVAEQPSVPMLEVLIARLEASHALLIFDNCEHLIATCAALAERLLQACPRLHILTTSREALRSDGEALWRVPSLSQAESQVLFIARAQAVRQGFEVTETHTATLARICQQLDGMPLAIELAAARMNALSLEQIAGRLDDRFNLLIVGKRTALPRHQTLRTAIVWSFDLLTPSEQALMACLSVFTGGFTAEAAQAVFDHVDTVALLAGLVDKSLVMVDFKAELVRYRLLETIRQFSLERLTNSGDENQMRDRHLAFFLALAEEPTDMSGPHVAAWKRRMDSDFDNLRTAFAWARTRNDEGEAALRLAGAMYPYQCYVGEHLEEGMTWADTALARGSGASIWARARALMAKAWLWSTEFGPNSAKQMFEESLALLRESQDRVGLGWCLEWLAFSVDDVRAPSWAEEALHLFREMGSLDGEAHALECMAAISLREGKHTQSAQLLEQAIAIAKWQIGECILPMYAVHPQRALELCAEEVARWKEAGSESVDTGILCDYGLLLAAEREFESARVVLEECIQWERKASEVRYTDETLFKTLTRLAMVEVSLGHPECAITHLEQAQNIARTRNWNSHVIGHIQFLMVSARIYADNLIHATRDLCECLQLFQKHTMRSSAICLFIQIADLSRRQGDLQHAIQMLGVARTFGHEVDTLSIGTLALWYRYAQGAIVEPTVAAAREQLGEAKFEAAFAARQAMTLDEAIALALERRPFQSVGSSLSQAES